MPSVAPSASADRSIVRHVLFLDGAGRATPYHSTTEDREIAKHFAGEAGAVYRTSVATATRLAVRHISRTELLRLLRGGGHGDAQWSDPFEVMQARRYVEQWREHLLDFSDCDAAVLQATLLGTVYEKA